MKRPPVRLVRANDTSRLVPSKHADETVLTRIAENDAHLKDIIALDEATNDRLLAENDLAPGISSHELVFGVPWFRIVNAAFAHAHPSGGRFNGPDRGAWSAGLELETAQAEVAHHKWLELSEVGWTEEQSTYVEYRADFSAEFHDLRGRREFRSCLDPDSYVASQHLAADLLAAGSLGVVYPSVRRPKGTCVACFRPALVGNVRQGERFQFRWSGSPAPAIERLR